MAEPTPAGVPVAMMSPGSSVTNRERNDTIAATGKIISAVVASCLTSPLTVSWIASACGSATASAERTHGPTGQKVSCHLPCSQSKNWSRSRGPIAAGVGRNFRSLTSLTTV